MKRDFMFSQELRIGQQSLPSGWVLTPQGAIDSNTTEQFTSRLRGYFEEKKPAPDLLLDLSGVKYLSSVGLGAFIQLLKKSQESRTAFALYNPQLAVRRVLEISKLDFLVVDPASGAASGPFAEYIAQKETQRPAPSSKKS